MEPAESVTYFVRYRGVPAPQDDFTDYYRRQHARILLDMPGISRLVLHVPTGWDDPFKVVPDNTDFLAEMTFPNAEVLAVALQSKARADARADFANVTRGHPMQVTHQAMRSLRVL
jgi:uncharacterized protein (TIGR02118 family)